MKIAVVHDDFVQFGGAEKLVLAVLEVWPDACLYTACVSRKWGKELTGRGIRYKTGFLQNFPFFEKLNRVYAFFGLHQICFASLDFSSYDVVLSISARFSHGVITKPNTLHICYMNSPGRMFWEPRSYFENESLVSSDIFSSLFWAVSALPLAFARVWDYVAAQRVDVFLANSAVPRDRIAKYYKRKSTIIYPFVDYSKFQKTQGVVDNPGYFLVVSRLLSWKRIEIAIEACKKLGQRLVVVGDGPHKAKLVSLSSGHKNIEFKGYVSEEEKIKLYSGCTAVINTQMEDFGIVPLEAMSAGKPVVAYGKGGVLETVLPGKTGEFFEEQTPDSLSGVLAVFRGKKYKPEDCRNQAQKFDKIKFQSEIKDFVLDYYNEYKKYVL